MNYDELRASHERLRAEVARLMLLRPAVNVLAELAEANADNAALADRLSGAELERDRVGAKCEEQAKEIARLKADIESAIKANEAMEQRHLDMRDAACTRAKERDIAEAERDRLEAEVERLQSQVTKSVEMLDERLPRLEKTVSLREHQIINLRAEVARLTRERDEARAAAKAANDRFFDSKL